MFTGLVVTKRGATQARVWEGLVGLPNGQIFFFFSDVPRVILILPCSGVLQIFDSVGVTLRTVGTPIKSSTVEQRVAHNGPIRSFLL